MREMLDRLENIKIENFVWVIYMGIIILSWYANSKEVNYLLYNDEESRQEYQNLLILIFSILFIIYFYFAKDSYETYLNLSIYDSEKKKQLTFASFISSLLILISGVIFLYIAIVDENIDTEIAFN